MKLALCQMAMSGQENENLERSLAAPNFYLREPGGRFDTTLLIDSDGALLGQQKMVHIAQACQFCEQDYYTPGDEGFQVFDTPHGRIGVVVCFDRQAGEAGRRYVEHPLPLRRLPHGHSDGLCRRRGSGRGGSGGAAPLRHL